MNKTIPTTLMVATEPDTSVLTEALRHAHWPFMVVPTPDEGLEQARTGIFDAIVIAEVLLPEPPGLFFRAIRERAGTPIVVAGWGGSDALTAMLLDGADVYLARPVPHDVLLARLQSLSVRKPRDRQARPVEDQFRPTES